MKGQYLLLLALLLSSQSVLFGQSDQAAAYQDETAYEVYSAILSSPEATRVSKSKHFIIRRETIRNFGAFLDTEPVGRVCLRPDAESEKLIGEALKDYVRVNQTTWLLQEKFRVDLPYRLISSMSVISLREQEDWNVFYKMYPDSGGFIDLSAVGFNPDKTVAVVSKGRWCGPLCGEGEYHVLQKKDGKWIPLHWTGELCSWIS